MSLSKAQSNNGKYLGQEGPGCQHRVSHPHSADQKKTKHISLKVAGPKPALSKFALVNPKEDFI